MPPRVLVLLALSASLVAQTPSSISLFSSPNSSAYGGPVTITATVTPSAATGHVSFYDGASVIGVGAISGGQALFITRLLNTGARPLRAHYSGDSTYAPSDSATFTQTVKSVPAGSLQAAANALSLPLASGVATSDLNGDGNLDLVIWSLMDGYIATALGNGDGTFQPPVNVAAGTPVVFNVAIADLNGDGIPDMAATSFAGVSIWIGKGDGTFTDFKTYFLPGAFAVAIGDFNDDGVPDLLIGELGLSAGYQVLLGNGDGTFQTLPAQTLSGDLSAQLVIGDFNGDGKTDIAALYGPPAGSLAILPGNGDGTFYSGASYATDNATGLATADLRNNGILDLVLVNGDNTVGVLLGYGDGTFQPPVNYGAGSEPGSVAVADFNGDGKPDLAVANGFSNDVSILLGNGDGTFRPAVDYAARPEPGGLATGDFNGDGRVDLAVANENNSGSLTILLGAQTGAPTLAAVSVSPSSGTGASQAFTFQFTDSIGATDIASMSVIFSRSANYLFSACVVTYTSATNSYSLLTDSGSAGSSLPAGGVTPDSLLANSQCSVDVSRSGVSSLGSSQSLTLTIGFSAAFAGGQTIRAVATSASGVTTSWQTLGSWNVPLTPPAAPQLNSVSPASGGGTAHTFTFTFTDANGPADLETVQAAIGSSTNAAASCVVLVQPGTYRIWLANDAGTGWVGFNLIGSLGSLSNSQCTVNVSGASSAWSGNMFTLTLPITFASGYTGPKTIYGDATSLTGADSGWQTLGTWKTGTAPIPGPFLISTIAGNAMPPTSMPATSGTFPWPGSVAVDPAGNVYFSDLMLNAVFRVDSSGMLSRVAGTGSPDYSGDNGPAVNAQLRPAGLAVDSAGNLFIADVGNRRVRKISPDGAITTVAGNGNCCSSQGDGGLAIGAVLVGPQGVALDASGNLFILDVSTNTIRKVDTAGIITTVAGNGTSGVSPDGTLATSASLASPDAIAVDASGNLYIAESGSCSVRKVTGGVITTVAGNGKPGFSGDGGPATNAQFEALTALAFDAQGNLYIGDDGNGRIRKVTPGGTITTVVGNGSYGYNGDGEAATNATLTVPNGLAVDTSGNLYIADLWNHRIREVSAGIISTVAGGATGDAAAAPQATFFSPASVANDRYGNVYVTDRTAQRIHVIAPSGATSVVAGDGNNGYSGDYGPASQAELNVPAGIAVDSNGALYIADPMNSRVRKVSGGTITTLAGTGGYGYSGDGGPAIAASVANPMGVAADSFGNLYIADRDNHRVRKVSTSGIITTVAGVGTPGYSGDGLAATSAELNFPDGVAVDGTGNLFIADTANNRIRMVNSAGVISTVAGSGAADPGGDGGPATQAELSAPETIALDAAGNLYIADAGNSRIRMVTTDGIITTIAGGGFGPGWGDGGPAVNAHLSIPQGLALDSHGNLYIADTGNRAIRLLTPENGPALLTASLSHSGTFALGGTGQYSLTVSNAPLAGATNGAVTVTEYAPAGMSISMSGDNWSCGANTCWRTDTLNAGNSYPSITVLASIASAAPSQLTNQVTVGGAGAALVGAQDLTLIAAPAANIQTSPAGLQFSVDGLPAMIAPQTLSLPPGPHLLAAPSPQSGPPGTQYAFGGWSDSGAETHSVDVTVTAETYIATFTTQYQLTTAAAPNGGGTVSPASGGFYNAGAAVTVTAQGVAPYTFSYWSGAALGAANSISVTMSAAGSAVANFVSCDINHDGKVDVGDLQQIVNEALGLAQPTDDLNHDGTVDVSDIQMLAKAVLGWF